MTVQSGTDKFFVVGRACELSAFSYAPIYMDKTGPTRSFFGKSRDPPAMQVCRVGVIRCAITECSIGMIRCAIEVCHDRFSKGNIRCAIEVCHEKLSHR